MRAIFLWLSELQRWLAQACVLWVFLLVTTVAIFFSFRQGATEFEVKLVSLGLQILGMATVVYGIDRTWRQFGRMGILGVFGEWVSHVPRWRPSFVEKRSNVHQSGIEAQRVLRQYRSRVTKWVLRGPPTTESVIHGHSEALRREQNARTADDESTRQLVKAAAIGSLHISLIGALWLLLGIPLGMLSKEISDWVK